jgi:hypothetical protein
MKYNYRNYKYYRRNVYRGSRRFLIRYKYVLLGAGVIIYIAAQSI